MASSLQQKNVRKISLEDKKKKSSVNASLKYLKVITGFKDLNHKYPILNISHLNPKI